MDISNRSVWASVVEFVAQIASYSRSPQRKRDLHLLVGIGAGTVDVEVDDDVTVPLPVRPGFD